jgi:hypothetical protein
VGWVMKWGKELTGEVADRILFVNSTQNLYSKNVTEDFVPELRDARIRIFTEPTDHPAEPGVVASSSFASRESGHVHPSGPDKDIVISNRTKNQENMCLSLTKGLLGHDPLSATFTRDEAKTLDELGCITFSLDQEKFYLVGTPKNFIELVLDFISGKVTEVNENPTLKQKVIEISRNPVMLRFGEQSEEWQEIYQHSTALMWEQVKKMGHTKTNRQITNIVLSHEFEHLRHHAEILHEWPITEVANVMSEAKIAVDAKLERGKNDQAAEKEFQKLLRNFKVFIWQANVYTEALSMLSELVNTHDQKYFKLNEFAVHRRLVRIMDHFVSERKLEYIQMFLTNDMLGFQSDSYQVAFFCILLGKNVLSRKKKLTPAVLVRQTKKLIENPTEYLSYENWRARYDLFDTALKDLYAGLPSMITELNEFMSKHGIEKRIKT